MCTAILVGGPHDGGAKDEVGGGYLYFCYPLRPSLPHPQICDAMGQDPTLMSQAPSWNVRYSHMHGTQGILPTMDFRVLCPTRNSGNSAQGIQGCLQYTIQEILPMECSALCPGWNPGYYLTKPILGLFSQAYPWPT